MGHTPAHPGGNMRRETNDSYAQVRVVMTSAGVPRRVVFTVELPREQAAARP